MNLVLTPAFGVDYKSKNDVFAAWAAGKDFRLEPSGKYTSVRDLEPMRKAGFVIEGIQFRYHNKARVAYLKV